MNRRREWGAGVDPEEALPVGGSLARTGAADLFRRLGPSLVVFCSCLVLAAVPAGGQVRMLGYFDVGAFASTGGETEGATGTVPEDAEAGIPGATANLLVAKRLSYQFSVLAEAVVEARPELPSDSTPGDVNASLERAHIRFDRLDEVKVGAGRFHTPLSYWGVAYNHGSWLYPTIEQPSVVNLGGRFLPGHLVGVQVEGNVWANGLNVNYHVGYGDGRVEWSTRDKLGHLESDGAAIAAIAIEPATAHGLRAGIAAYTDTLTLPATNDKVDEDILSAHLHWRRGLNEFTAEVAHVRHDDSASGQSFGNFGYYLQVTYQLPYFNRRLILVNRIEELDQELGDPVYGKPSERQVLVGLRLDVNDSSAVKAEVRQLERAGRKDSFGLFANWSVAF